MARAPLDDLAAAYGYASLEVSFKATKEASISWKIYGKKVYVVLSDYFEGAPNIVILELCESAILWAKGGRMDMPSYRDWVSNGDFIERNRRMYLKRSRNLARTEAGEHRNLTDSLDRLLESGLVLPSDIENSYFTWTARPNYGKVGYCSPMMRVVAVSRSLDSADVPEAVLDYVVYHETLHLRQGFRPFCRSHDREFRQLERLYPDKDGCNRFLRSMKNSEKRRIPEQLRFFPREHVVDGDQMHCPRHAVFQTLLESGLGEYDVSGVLQPFHVP